MTKRYGFHFTSLIAVIVFMVVGYSPMLSVFYSTLMCFVLSAITPETALGAETPAVAAAGDLGRHPGAGADRCPDAARQRAAACPDPARGLAGMTDLVGYYLPALLLVLLAGWPFSA